MIMRMIPIRYALAAALFAGCGGDPEIPAPAPLPGDRPVVFSAANSSSTAATKSLVGNQQEAGTTTLEEICTPGGGGEAIAIWGDYCRNGISSDVAEYTTVFRDTHLV